MACVEREDMIGLLDDGLYAEAERGSVKSHAAVPANGRKKTERQPAPCHALYVRLHPVARRADAVRCALFTGEFADIAILVYPVDQFLLVPCCGRLPLADTAIQRG